MACIPIMVFIICNLIGNYTFGLLAGFLTTFSGILIQHSQYAIVDVALSFFCLLFFTILIFWLIKSEISYNKIIILSFLIGIAISMKYTGAILIVSLFFIIYKFMERESYYAGAKNFQLTITGILGVGFFLFPLIYLLNKEFILQGLTGLTTDGIIEIEYHNLVNKLIIIFLGSGLV